MEQERAWTSWYGGDGRIGLRYILDVSCLKIKFEGCWKRTRKGDFNNWSKEDGEAFILDMLSLK